MNTVWRRRCLTSTACRRQVSSTSRWSVPPWPLSATRYLYVHVRGHVHVQKMYIHVYTCCHGFESHPRQLIFLRESDCLGCAVLLCLVVCLTLFVSSFLPSHLMYTNTYRSDAHTCTCRYIYTCTCTCIKQTLR